eukprot:TRINITY_DN14069_c0_g2_i2.p1 TRINITY_DN14069_c0_g2~~TRINITY_DN14069_c0_g2_i2.p1  ORF type:complete len:272 (-),score=60.37 TRINITY_DN14069_c0_g2_i2:674-1489(-)
MPEKRVRIDGDSDEGPPESWMNAFRDIVCTSMDDKLKPLVTQIEGVKTEQTEIKKDISCLNTRMLALESADRSAAASTAVGSSLCELEAKRLEVKGWCTARTKSTEGMTRQQVMELYGKLCATCDASVREKISAPVLFGSKNSNFLIPVKGDVMEEVLGSMRELLASDDDLSKQGKIFIRKELPQWRKNANGLLAKILSLIRSLKEGVVAEPVWFPDFAVECKTGAQNKMIIVVKLDQDDRKQVIWTEEGIRFLNMSEHDLNAALRQHKMR